MAVLVTGGAGFVGSHFVEHLLRETESPLVLIDNFNAFYDPALKRQNVRNFASQPRITLVEGDFGDGKLLGELFARHKIDQVVHLGAWAGVPYSVEHPEIYIENNVTATVALLEAARRTGVKRFLFASSSTVYGRGTPTPFSEDKPLGIPLSPYGASKQAAEIMGFTWHKQFGVPFVSLRFFNVYGPRLRPELALAVFARAILEGKPIPLFGDGTVRRDFTHVTDICRGILTALTEPQAVGEAINLGHDHPIEMKDLIQMISQAAGKPAIIDRRPARAEDMPATHANLAKARRLLNYEPRVSIEEGVREYVAWMKQTL